MVEVNFLFSSVTFIQLYLPLVIEFKKRNIKVNFFWRKNSKSYADPGSNKKKWEPLLKKLEIKILPASDLVKHPGIIICVDGDIYGPKPANVAESMLTKINRNKYLIISLIENLNFKWCYDSYAPWIDHLILPNQIYANTYNLKKTKNLYLGASKYGLTFNKAKIYQKYKLLPDKKHVVIFYPRMERGIKKYGKNFPEFYYDLYLWLRDLGFKVIIKNRDKIRPKRPPTRDSGRYKENFYYTDVSIFPPTSLELLQIADLAIFFGSSVIEEIVYYKVPFVEVVFDPVNRFEFLRNPSYQYLIKDRLPNEGEFKKGVKKLLANSQNYQFDKAIKNHLFNGNNLIPNMTNQILELHKKKFSK